MMNAKLNKLKTMRIEKGLTTTEMAKSLGISQSMYSYVENGDKRLSYDLAVKLANVFDTSPDDLFFQDFENFYNDTII